MAQQYDNTNRGLLSRNTRREKDTQPEYTGSINIEGREFWLNGWVKEKKDGSGKFFSLSVKAKEPITIGPDEPRNGYAPLNEQLNDDIPF